MSEDNGLIKADILSNKGLSQLWDINKQNIMIMISMIEIYMIIYQR